MDKSIENTNIEEPFLFAHPHNRSHPANPMSSQLSIEAAIGETSFASESKNIEHSRVSKLNAAKQRLKSASVVKQHCKTPS
jgi:hypothetical protein